MARVIVLCVVVSALQLTVGGQAHATPFTPLEWQQEVRHHAFPGFVHQKKHVSWSRDVDHNFVDDELEYRFGHLRKKVSIIVDLNHCMPDNQLKAMLGKYGKVTYIGRLITYVLMSDVSWLDVFRIALLPDVAMVEWQMPSHVANNISTRDIQVYPSASTAYGTNSVQSTLPSVTGKGITVAVLDTGVDDLTHDTFKMPPPAPAGTRKFKAGFDACGGATCTPGFAGTVTNPTDSNGHGTMVAGTILGSGFGGSCRTGSDVAGTVNCAGVAPEASLVDIRVCDSTGNCPADAVATGLDWLGMNAATYRVKVANLSFANCAATTRNDGTDAMSQEVNYLVAATGVTVVAAFGDSNDPLCSTAAGTTRVSTPGAASLAITVAATDDHGTVTRTDDTLSPNYLTGPRHDFTLLATPVVHAALKPDLAAPGTGINTSAMGSATGVGTLNGTSAAAALVSGTAALVMQIKPGIDPGGLKDFLLTSAVDQSSSLQVATYPAITVAPWNKWNNALGNGMLNVFAATSVAGRSDVKFPNCVTPAASPGTLCGLTPPLPPWDNDLDISTSTAPQVGVPTNILANVQNTSTTTAVDVSVNFGVYVFGAGTNQFWHVGTQRVHIPPSTTMPVSQPWTPAASNHQCAQVSIDYGLDTDWSNNVTQRNLSVSPSVYQVRVENPYFETAHMTVDVKSNRAGWTCKIQDKDKKFDMGPFDCPHEVTVTYDAPAGAKADEKADCDVQISATTKSRPKIAAIGGVTTRTFVPRPCKLVGMVFGPDRKPVAGAKLVFTWDRNKKEVVKGETDAEGIFSTTVTPFIAQTVEVERPGVGKGVVHLTPTCGAGGLQIELGREGASIRDREHIQ
jgi:serine protease AprX